MIKIKLCSLLLLLSCFLFSCDGGDDPVYEIEGRWVVKVREFECSDKDVQKQLERLYQLYLEDGRKEYLLFSPQGDSGYFEEGYTGTNGFDLSRYSGRYSGSAKDGKLDVVVSSLADTWTYTLEVEDVNSEFVFLKQKMDSDDINRLFSTYFQSQVTAKEGVTAVWSTKAFKEKTQE